nr:HDOD domain-containing protein [Opitutaceae bacterium]
LARRTLATIAKGMEGETVAGMAEIARLIETLTVDGLKVSVQELADIIEKDVIVTAKILRAANLLCHNQTFIDIESIEDAIRLVGFNKIRSLALSLLLMENLRRPGAAKVHRQAATVALANSLLTQTYAQLKGRDDAEYAFLYASLRQFGHLLLAAFLPEDYQRALGERRTLGDFNLACRKLFGLTAHEVGVEHLKTMQFPSALLSSLQPFSPALLTSAKDSPSTQLLLASEMGRQIAELVMDDAVTPEEYQTGLARVRTTFQEPLRLTAESFRDMMAQTEQRFDVFGRSFGIGPAARQLSRRFSAPPTADVASAPASPSASPTRDTPPRDSPSSPPQTDARAEPAPEFFVRTETAHSTLDVLMEAIAEAGVILASDGKTDKPRGLLALVQQTIDLCWKPESVRLFREQAREVYVLDVGDQSALRPGSARFTLGERSIFGVAARQNECVRIHDSLDLLIRPHLPAWFKPEINLRACLIVPAGDRTGSRLLACFGWRYPKHIAVTPAEIRALRILLGMLATAKPTAA